METEACMIFLPRSNRKHRNQGDSERFNMSNEREYIRTSAEIRNRKMINKTDELKRMSFNNFIPNTVTETDFAALVCSYTITYELLAG